MLHRVADWIPDWANRRLENSVSPAVNRYLLELEKDKAAEEERWAMPFIYCAQATVGLLCSRNSAPTGTDLWVQNSVL